MKPGINLAEICYTRYMSELDLTADAHNIRMPTFSGIPRTFLERFYARFDYRYMGLTVLAEETSTNTWSISTFPGLATVFVDDLNDANHVFHGPNTYTVTGSLATALASAGYTVT